MSKAGRFFLGLFKWLVIPVALGFVGFAFIGPYIGRKPPEALKKIQDKIVAPEPTTPAADSSAPEEGSGKEWPEPKVEVELRRLNGERVKDRETSKDPVTPTVEPGAVIDETPSDPASGAGTTEEAPAAAPTDTPPTEPLPEGPGN